MAKPEGSLSPIQFRILTAIWDRGPRGATVAEIWEEVRKDRDVVRTTVLKLVDRLAARGWLQRHGEPGSLRYRATVPRSRVERQVTSEFVDGFFGGSAAHLVRGLLGSGRISQDEITRLRRLLDGVED
jgi:predicted transcriptional regulator